MNNLFLILLSVIAGAALGSFFYGGLWWTIRKLPTTRQAGLLFALSWIIRMGVVLVGLYFCAGGVWYRMLAGLVGLMIARVLLSWILGGSLGKQPKIV